MSTYRINLLACIAAYAGIAGFIGALSWSNGFAALALGLVGFTIYGIAFFFAGCPACRKSPMIGRFPANELLGINRTYGWWSRPWPEQTCSECGRDLHCHDR